MPRHRILLIDDDRGIRFGIRNYLVGRDYEVQEAETIQQGEELYRSDTPDLVLLDYSLPDGNAIELLPRLKSSETSPPVIILTAHGSIELAVNAIKEGADQFLTKPIQMGALGAVIERLLDTQRIRHKEVARTVRRNRNGIDPFIGTSEAIRSLAELAQRIAVTDRPVLIQGETGTGKTVLATWLHANGPRAGEAFVDLNCAGLAREFVESELFGHEKGAFTGAIATKSGLLELAHRGVLFLDEIGDVDINVQPKLLKVLEEKRFRRLGDVRDRRVDVQLIAATHQDLNALVREKRFRGDLYFRISTIPLMIPPLRERREDIPLLARHFVAAYSEELGRLPTSLSPAAERMLLTYHWPGNIRELRNVLERAVLLTEARTLEPRDLRFDAVQAAGEDDGSSELTLDEMERRHIERVLRRESGRVEAAAQRLGIPRSSLYQKIKRFDIRVSRS
jgi:DNA-binding NtrC family response regulator